MIDQKNPIHALNFMLPTKFKIPTKRVLKISFCENFCKKDWERFLPSPITVKKSFLALTEIQK